MRWLGITKSNRYHLLAGGLAVGFRLTTLKVLSFSFFCTCLRPEVVPFCPLRSSGFHGVYGVYGVLQAISAADRWDCVLQEDKRRRVHPESGMQDWPGCRGRRSATNKYHLTRDSVQSRAKNKYHSDARLARSAYLQVTGELTAVPRQAKIDEEHNMHSILCALNPQLTVPLQFCIRARIRNLIGDSWHRQAVRPEERVRFFSRLIIAAGKAFRG